LDLFLHESIDFLQKFLIDRSPGKIIRAGKQERPGICTRDSHAE